MCRTIKRRVLMTCCAAAVLLGAPSRSWAECALWDWMFGHGQTTYAPPYSPPNVYVPAAGACGCAPVQCAPVRCAPVQCAPAQPACQPCVPTATYRISYRPVPTVAYMPVVGTDPCSGCAVTTYRPTQTWTYQASLVPYSPYRVGYAPVAVGVAPCGSCGGCAPCSGYSASCGGCAACGTSYGGCSSCGCGTSYGGCSSCNAGVSSGYVPSGGCSSCASTSGAAVRHAAARTERHESASDYVITLEHSRARPGSSSAPARTYVPGATEAPISPSAPASPSSSGTSYRGSIPSEAIRTVEPPRIEDIPPIPGPQLGPTPNPRPENENRTNLATGLASDLLSGSAIASGLGPGTIDLRAAAARAQARR